MMRTVQIIIVTILLIKPGFSQEFENSRFGIFGAYALEYRWFMDQIGFDDSEYWNWVDEHFTNLGAHWTRSNTQLIWKLIDPDLNGNYVWDIITNPDSVITNVYDSPAGVNWLGSIHLGLEPDGSFRNPLEHPVEWQNFLMAVVVRYNGDGNNDLNEFVNVKYWQLGNEIFQLLNAGLTPEEYAEIVALSESAIHSVDPEAKICLVAPTIADYVDPYLQLSIQSLAGQGTPFDVIDIHHWNTAGNYKMMAVPAYRQLLNDYGTATFSFSISSLCEWTNLIPMNDRREFESQILQPGNHTITIETGEVFLLKVVSATSVEDENVSPAPNGFSLKQNYPNPFSSTTTISYEIPYSAHVTLTIYDLTGNSVITLVEKQQAAGRQEVQWNGLSNLGQPVSPGVYAMQLQAGNFVQAKKIFLMK